MATLHRSVIAAIIVTASASSSYLLAAGERRQRGPNQFDKSKKTVVLTPGLRVYAPLNFQRALIDSLRLGRRPRTFIVQAVFAMAAVAENQTADSKSPQGRERLLFVRPLVAAMKLPTSIISLSRWTQNFTATRRFQQKT